MTGRTSDARITHLNPAVSHPARTWQTCSLRLQTYLDIQLQSIGVFYTRFMDDVLVLASTRWKLRHATQVVNRVLSRLLIANYPDKTFIGRISKGFDFLGYHFSPTGLTVAAPTVARFVARAHRLPKKLLRVRLRFRPVRARGWRHDGEDS